MPCSRAAAGSLVPTWRLCLTGARHYGSSAWGLSPSLQMRPRVEVGCQNRRPFIFQCVFFILGPRHIEPWITSYKCQILRAFVFENPNTRQHFFLILHDLYSAVLLQIVQNIFQFHYIVDKYPFSEFKKSTEPNTPDENDHLYSDWVIYGCIVLIRDSKYIIPFKPGFGVFCTKSVNEYERAKQGTPCL